MHLLLQDTSGCVEKTKMWCADDTKTCMKNVENALSTDPHIKFLRQAILEHGCAVPKSYFRCTPCRADMTSGFVPDDKDEHIAVCTNTPLSEKNLKITLRHELIHAFDNCRADVNFNDCVHHACTEVRAVNLSGECQKSLERARGFDVKDDLALEKCVRRRAHLALMKNPSCRSKDGLKAWKAVNKAWTVAYADSAPYDMNPQVD
eukprot:531239_1